MNLLTEKQKIWFKERTIEVGQEYMFPRFGFEVYEKPSYISRSYYLDTNPYTKSLDNERFIVKEKINGFCKGNFVGGRKKCPDFYIDELELKMRDKIEQSFLYFFCFIPLVIYNKINQKFNNQKLQNNEK